MFSDYVADEHIDKAYLEAKELCDSLGISKDDFIEASLDMCRVGFDSKKASDLIHKAISDLGSGKQEETS
jgi:hypothetical protein